MNGAQSLLHTLAAGGIEVLFTNPGTSELYLVDALERVDALVPVLGLAEAVCAGAADGYARVSGRPAATLFHLGPGLANGLSCLHNARRARSPVLNLVGDHATWHRPYDPPLASDIESLARPVSAWVRTSRDATGLAGDAAAALAAARAPPGGVATLIVPADCTWSEAAGPVPVPGPAPRAKVEPAAVTDCAAALRTGRPAMLLLNGQALAAPGLTLAARIAGSCGARLACDTFPALHARGAGQPCLERVPYFPEQALAMLAGVEHLVLAGARPPVSFFAYPDQPGLLVPETCRIHTLAAEAEDAADALARLAAEIGARDDAAARSAYAPPPRPRGALDPASLAMLIGHLLPEGALVVDEALTGTPELIAHTARAAPHAWISHIGGAIGQGLPVATGAAFAAPGRKVICLEGDGSGMYTVQALWTQARHRLDVTTVIYANGRYRILALELERLGNPRPGPVPGSLVDISQPSLDWVALARGLGVAAERVSDADGFARVFEAAMRAPGPHLIEAVL